MHDASRSESLMETMDPRLFLRTTLARLEAQHRKWALRGLADWKRTEIVAPSLFRAVASLQRPSWGHWNGLLLALREARREVLRTGTPAERERIAEARVFNEILEFMERDLDKDCRADFSPLVELTRVSWPRKPRVTNLLSLPIALRNLVAHFAPLEDDWWEKAAAALWPIVTWCSEPAHLLELPDGPVDPWIIQPHPDGELWSFNGLDGDAVNYVDAQGQRHPSAEQLRAVTESFQRLLDQTGPREEGLKRLLARLAPEDMKGVLLGDCLVGRPVGSGGYATVHRGTQLSTGRMVAVKILHDHLNEEERERFLQEAAFLSQFNHPHIAQVLSRGEEPWFPPRDPALASSLAKEDWYRTFAESRPKRSYMVLEWIEGGTLEDVFQGRRTVPSRQVLTEWFAQTASALVAVHGAGLIHRDVKPGNVMIGEDGVVRLMDFGIARSQDEHRTLRTTPGKVLGTPAYLAPEQLAQRSASEEWGEAGDIYSLCATYYELFTGRRIFDHDRETQEALTTRKLNEPHPEHPRMTSADLSWEIETILLGGLQREPADRYRSMADLERDLQHVLRQEPIEYRRPTLKRRFQLWWKRSPAVARLVTTVAVLLVLIVVGAVVSAAVYQDLAWRESQAKDLANSRGELAEQRRLQEQAARIAETAAKLAAQESDRQSRDRLVRQLVGNGWQTFNVGDKLAAVPLFVQALAADERNSDAEVVHRTRLAAVLRQCPKLVQVWFPGGQIYDADLSSDGRRVFALGSDNLAYLLDAETGNPVGEFHEVEHIEGGVFSGDGRQLLTWGKENEDKTLTGRLWNTDTGEQREIAVSSEIRIGEGYFGPHDDWAVLVNREVSYVPPPVLFETKTGQIIDVPGVREDRSFNRLAFARTVPRIAVSTSEKVEQQYRQITRVWDLASGEQIGPDMQLGFDFNMQLDDAGERLLVYTSMQGDALKVWDVHTGKLVGPEIHHGEEIVQASFSPDGRSVVTVSDIERYRNQQEGRLPKAGEAQVWNVETGEPKGEPFRQLGSIEQATFTTLGHQLVTMGEEETRLWDVASGRQVCPPIRHRVGLRRAHLSQSGRWLLTAGAEGSVRLWDLSEGDLLTTIRTEGPIQNQLSHYNTDRQVAFASRQNPLLAIGFYNAQLLDPSSGRPLSKSIRGASHAALSPDGKLLAVAGSFSKPPEYGVRLFRTDTGEPLTEILKHDPGLRGLPGDLELAFVTFHPKGNCFITGAPDNTARVWDTKTGELLVPPLKHSSAVISGMFSLDGSRFLTVCAKEARVWDAETFEPIGEPLTTLEELQAAAISPDGQRVMLGTGQRYGNRGNAEGFTAKAEIYDVATGKTIGKPLPLPGAVRSLCFRPDGNAVLTSCQDGTARVWEAETGEPITPPMRHQVEAHDAFFTPDGRFVVCACGTEFGISWQLGEVRMWDAQTGEPVIPPISLPLPTRSAAVNSEQTLLAAGAKDLVRVWDIAPETRPVEDLLLLAQLMSEMHIDDHGYLAVLSPNEYRALWETYKARQPLESRRADTIHLMAWHDREAVHAETTDRWDVAVEHLAALCKHAPDDWQRQARLGYASYRLGEYEEAEAALTKSLDLGGSDQKIPYHRGLTRLERQLWAEAIADFEQLIQAGAGQFQSDWEIHYHKARGFFGQGDWAATIKTCDEALRVLGHPYLADFAREQQLAVERANGEWRPWELRGRAYHELLEWEKAVEDYSLALEGNPHRMTSQINRGVCLVELGRFEEAQADLKAAKDAGKVHWLIDSNLAASFAGRGQWEPAKVHYIYALQNNLHSTLLWYRTCLVLLKSENRYEDAFCDRLVSEFSNASAGDRLLIAWSCLLDPNGLKDWSTLLKWCKEASENTDVSYRNLALGFAHSRSGNHEAAIPLLTEAQNLKLPEEAILARYGLAITYWNANRPDEARTAFQSAAKLHDQLKISPADWTVKTELEVMRQEAEQTLAEKIPAKQEP